MVRKNINWLVFKSLLGELTSDEKSELDQWLEESKRNKAFYNRIAKGDKIAKSYKQYQSIDQDAAFNDFLLKTGQKGKRAVLPMWTRYAAAAVVLLALSFPLVKFLQSNPSEEIMPGRPQAVLIKGDGSQQQLGDGNQEVTNENHVVATNTGNQILYSNVVEEDENDLNTLVVPRGGEYTVKLSDGTVVHLNSDSKLTYPVAFGKTSREVTLKGEAYFEIAKDASRPFYVDADGIKVKQYGTAFNVNNRKDSMINVVLVHGSISVMHNGSNERMMNPSDLVSYYSITQTFQQHKVDIRPYIAWHEGSFIFENKRLSDIMENLSLWYDMDYEFEQSDLENLSFTGTLSRKDPIENILQAIAFTTDVDFAIDHHMVTIRNKN